MSKHLTVQLNGEPMILNVGVGRFYNLFKESTGKDILNYASGFDTSELMDIVCGIVYAGYNAECKLNKLPPKYTKEEIFDLVLNADTEQVTQIYKEYNTLFSTGESESQPK